MAKTTLDLLRERQSESVLRNLSESSPLPKLTNTDSEFTKGLASAALGVEAGLRGFAANIAENFAPEWAKSQLGEINKLTKQAAAVGPRVTDLRDIHGVGDAVDFAMGGLGQAVPSIGTALAGGGLANLGLKAAGFTVRPLAANIIGGTAGLLPQEAGEAAVTMYQDPVAMANTTPAERTALMLGKGTVNAALESLVPSMMGEKVLGNSLTQFIKPGIKPALAHAGKETLKNAAYESATEGAQQVTGNIAHHIANPNEDLLGGWDVINAAAMGALPGAVMGAGGAGGDIFRSNIGMQKTDDGEIAPPTFKTAQKAGEETGREVGYATGWLGKKLAAMLAGKGETTRKNMQELAPEEELVINSQDKSVGLGEAITYNLRNEWGVPTNEELEEAKHILSYVLSRTISDKGIDRAEGVLQHYFGDRAERFLDMVHNYRLMPEMYGPQSQLSGMGSVGAEDIHGDMSDEDSADFGSDTATYDELSDDGSEKRHEWNDRLQVVDEDKDPERISFSDLDKWATPKAVPWTEEEMEEAKVSDRTKAFQMALQNRRMQRSKDGKLVPDDGIYLKRDTNLVDTETGEVRKPEVFRTSARTLVEQAREMGQNNDADIDEISNHESVVRDFLRGLSTLIDSGQFTSVGGMKAGKRVGPAQDMKFVALYSRPDKKTLYDTKEAAQQAIDDKKEPGSVKKDGATGRYYVNWSNSQEVLDPITKSYDAMLRVIKSLPQDMEIMPGVTMASAQAALKERLISTGYKTPKSAKDFPESNNPARSARMSNRRSMEYKTRTRLDELSVEGLSQEYAAASSDTPFDIARRDDIMDEVVDRLRKAGLDENEAYEVISGERVKDVPQIEPEVLGRAKSNAATFTTTGATQYTLIAGPRNEKGGLLSKSSAMQFAKEGDVVRKLQSGGWVVERPVGPSVSSNPRYSKGVATKTKSSGSSENGKNITRVDKWGAVSLPQEQELFRKPKKHDAENIDEDRRTAGDLESDLLGVRNFNENIEGRQEPIHGERPTPRNPFSNAASALDELAKRLAGAIESGAHPKHMEHLIKQIGAIKQRNKLAEARKTVVAKLEYGAHTNRKNAPENQGATPAELEAMEKGAEARKAEVARLEELHEQLINASMMLAGKVDAPYTEGLSRQILIALKTGAQLPTRVDKAVQRLSDRAMSAAVEKKLVIGKSDTAIDVVKDETSAAMVKVAPSDQLQRIAAFLEQVKADPAAHKSRARQILARAKAFDSAYHGWDITRAFKDALGVGNVKKPAAPVKSSSDTTMTMAFTDGTIYGGSAHNMRPEFAGKSTMDLIKDGKRTATTRRQRPNVNVGDIITMDDTRGTKIQVVVTKAPYQLKWGVDQDKNKANAEKWSELEGWAPEVFEAYAKSGSWQFQYELAEETKNNVVTRQNAQRDIRTAFAAIDDAKNAKASQEGRDALTEAHHLISIANVSEAQEWVARRKLKAAEDKVRKLQDMEGAAEHEQNIKYSEQRSSEEPDIPGTFASLHEDPETKDAIEKWLKEVAPQATVEFVEALKGGGSGSWSLSPATGERLVKVSVYSQHPWSIAYHEALHDLFQTLRESGHDEAIRIMQDVASMPNIKKRLAMLLDGHPEAIKQLDDPEEAAAYLFQFWALGYQGLDKLNTMIKGLGPKTENFFTKLWRAIRDTFGWLSDQEKAELIMANFYEAKLADPIAMKAVMDKVENSSTAFSSAIAPIKQLGDKVFATADARLRESGFKSFVTLTDLFQPDLTGKSKAKMMDNTEDNIGLFNAVYQMENKGIAELADSILDGVTPDELNKALEHLQVGRDVRDIENPVEQAIVNKTRKLLGKYITYLRDAGVTSWDEESRSFKLIGDLGKNYFPRKWDFDMLIQHGDEFISDLVAKHADVLQKLVDKEIEARRKTDPNADVSKITIENAARTIHAHLTNQGGMETMMPHDIREGEDIGTLTETKEKLGFTPFMVAANERSLKFIDMEHFHKYLEKDYVKTMTTYIAQAVKRAEYSRRFGPQGQRIAQAMQKSEEQAVKALYRDEWENFDKRVAQIEDQLKAESTVRRLTSQPIHSKDEIEARREELYVQEFENWTARSKELQKKGADKVAEFSDTIRALEGTLGRDISPQLRNFNSWMMTYQSWRLLPLSLFSSVTDPLGIMIRGGSAKQAYNAFVRGVKEVYRTYKNQPSTSSDDPAVKLAKDFGMLEAVGALDALGQSYSSVYMSSGPKKASDLLFKINGMEAWNRAMRIQGTVAAVEWLKEAIGTTDPNVARQLKELGLTQDDLKLKKDGTLDLSNPDKKIQRAVATWVNTAILRPNAAQRPVWASNPKMSLFFHLMQYTYSMQKVILGRVWHEAKHGNWTPLTTMAVAYTPVAIAGMAVKGVIQGGGDEPEWMKGMGPVDWLIVGVNRAGLLGIPGSILETNESSDLAKGDNGTIGDKMVGTMLPMPAVDQLMDIVSPGSNDNLKTDFVKALPLSTVFRGWAPVHDWTKS